MINAAMEQHGAAGEPSRAEGGSSGELACCKRLSRESLHAFHIEGYGPGRGARAGAVVSVRDLPAPTQPGEGHGADRPSPSMAPTLCMRRRDRAAGVPVAEAVLYKTTRFTDLVVQRRVRLYADRLQTQHSGGPDDATEKSWMLDRGCKLDPESAEDIQKQQRVIRPPGTWTVTAAATAKGLPIELVRRRTRPPPSPR